MRTVKLAIGHPLATLSLAVLLLVGVVQAYGKYGNGVEFFPDIEPDFGLVQVRARGNLSIHEKDALVWQVEERLLELDGPGLAGFDAEALGRESNIPASRVAAFALIRAEDGIMTEIVEKPGPDRVAAMAGAPVSMTCWRFGPSIFDACRDVAPSSRGELELPDAVALSMERGTRYRVVPVRAGVLDMSRREDIPAVERILARRALSSPT